MHLETEMETYQDVDYGKSNFDINDDKPEPHLPRT